MGLPRFAAKRDANEPPIIQALEFHGALVQPNSMKGYPDLGVFFKGQIFLAEVKVPGEFFTPEQMDGFKKILAHGVPIYVLECPEDGVKMLRGELQPWNPEGALVRSASGGRQKHGHTPGRSKARTLSEACTTQFCATSSLNGGRGPCAKHAPQSPKKPKAEQKPKLPAPVCP